VRLQPIFVLMLEHGEFMLPYIHFFVLASQTFMCSTWTEFASDVNGKKLSRLNGANDEEKLVDLCNIIEEQVQKLKPYQPIANSHVLVKLYCRNPEHNRQVVLDICPGELRSHSDSLFFRILKLFFQTTACCAATACTIIVTLHATLGQ
jgi:hypothetical protein